MPSLVDLTTALGALDTTAQMGAAATFVLGATFILFNFKTIKGFFIKGA